MISVFLSASVLSDDQLKEFISKKLDLINNVQVCLGRNGDIILIPTDFPRSILSVLYAFSVADYVLFYVGSEINSLSAELALCVENSNINEGYCVINDYSDINSFDKFFLNYRIGKFKKVKTSQEINYKKEVEKSGLKYVSIDKHFIVKGIGSVIIGFVIGDTVSKGDRLFLLPSLKQCSVKSIQIMDVDSTSAEKGSHVGLSLNNISESDLSSNYAVSSSNSVYSEFTVALKVSDFYKEDMFAKQLSCAVFGETFSVNLVKDDDKVKIKFNRPVPKLSGRYLLLDPSLSIGRNRVVGSFEIA
jgi:selenocysteine-specific translation elongation factor